MGFEREKRLAVDPRGRELDDELARQLLEAHQTAQPGKRTLIEQQLTQGLGDGDGSRLAVGRRTLLEQEDREPAGLAPLASSAAPAAYPALAPPSGPASALDDFRSRGLHDVLAALLAMERGRGLMEATLSAARRLTRPVQPSLTVRAAPPDPAGHAMWRAAERRAATLYRHAVDSGDVEIEDTAVEQALARAGGGQPLPAAVRRQMELELDISLDRVRVHTDSVAADAAQAVRARAFTIGEDIFFADGAYAPDTPAGRRLLAHELTHVLQAYQGRTATGGAGVRVSSPGESLEREADGVAARLGGRRAAPTVDPAPAPSISMSISTAGMRVMRQPAGSGPKPGEASAPVGKLARVQAPKGVFLRARPAPDGESSGGPIPFNALVFVERRTTQDKANARWCHVVAAEAGAAGYCEERYLAIDPPEPAAKLRIVKAGERLAAIAEEEYGPPKDQDNSRLYVQALYIANRDRAGVKLEHVELGLWDRALRGEEEEATLKIYRGAKVIAGNSIWIPTKAFVERLKSEGSVTDGSTHVKDAAKSIAENAVDAVKYLTGLELGLLKGAFNAVVDLFKGALEMIEAVLEVTWNLITGNLGRIKDMATGWVDKMKTAWSKRGQILDDFLNKWTNEDMWERGLFQGEVLGWIAMTVLLIVLTMGEGAPGALAGIAARWPQVIKLLKTVDALGDVTTYLGAVVKTVKLPSKAAKMVSGKLAKPARVAEDAAEELGKDTSRTGKQAAGTVEDLGEETAGTGKKADDAVEDLGEETAGTGKKPPRGTEAGTKWRYERYKKKWHQRPDPKPPLMSLEEYKAANLSGGRAGGPAQRATRRTLAETEGFINTESVQLGTRIENGKATKNMVDMYKPGGAAGGGTKFVEVDPMTSGGLPSSNMRKKLKAELAALQPGEELLFVDSNNSARRILYKYGEPPSVVDTRTGAVRPRRPPRKVIP